LLRALRAFDLELFKLLRGRHLGAALRHVDLAFLITLGAGIACALMVFTRIIPLPRLIVTHPEQVYGLFFGLIVASVAVLVRSVPGAIGRDGAWVFVGVAAGLLVVNLVPVNTPQTVWFVFLCGALAISAMLMPGISGSFILLILRKYAYVFDAIGRLDLTVLVPFALGAATGVLVFSRVLTWLLDRFYRQTLLTIIGVLFGSLWMIWPFQERIYEIVRDKPRLVRSSPVWPDYVGTDEALALAWCLAGVAAVLVLQVLAARRRTPLDA
jgi:putative membrane protein